MPRRQNPEHQRYFEERTTITDGCWIWQGGKTAAGYAMMYILGGRQYAHRWAYQMFVGPIPDNCEIDHVCRNRGCVRPDHLQAVSHRVNCSPERSSVGWNTRAKTHCPKGHAYNEENTYQYFGKDNLYHRFCRICHYTASMKYAEKRRAQTANS
jgi:hypothetical protein